MFYLIQENLYREFHHKTLIEYLDRYNLPYEHMPFRPFTDELIFKTDRKDVWLFGSVNASKIGKKYGWNPGSLYNENHDFEVYGSYYGKDMLNSDGVVISAYDPVPDKMGNVFFARPTKDTKVFSGGLFTRGQWEDYMKETDDTSVRSAIDQETKILVAPPKHIQQEIRCWVVGGKIASISQYKIGNRVVYQNHDNNEEAHIFVRSLIKKFQPAKAYVIDICLFQDEYKVVEINCINCSGFYDVDMSKLIQALENTFGE